MTEQQFHTEYLSLSATLYKIAYYMLESEAEAEDAVQEVFLKLWESRDALDGISYPKAYCVRMLKNLCIDRIRKAQHLAFPEELPEPEPVRPGDEALDAKKRLNNILEAIKALPERHRQVLVLRTIEGLSYEEIAERTGINYLTLRVLLSQARAKLKKA